MYLLLKDKKLLTNKPNVETNLKSEDEETNLKSEDEETLAPGVSEMIDQAIAQNYIPLAKPPSWLVLPE